MIFTCGYISVIWITRLILSSTGPFVPFHRAHTPAPIQARIQAYTSPESAQSIDRLAPMLIYATAAALNHGHVHCDNMPFRQPIAQP